jgi:hypothetical protein
MQVGAQPAARRKRKDVSARKPSGKLPEGLREAAADSWKGGTYGLGRDKVLVNEASPKIARLFEYLNRIVLRSAIL